MLLFAQEMGFALVSSFHAKHHSGQDVRRKIGFATLNQSDGGHQLPNSAILRDVPRTSCIDRFGHGPFVVQTTQHENARFWTQASDAWRYLHAGSIGKALVENDDVRLGCSAQRALPHSWRPHR